MCNLLGNYFSLLLRNKFYILAKFHSIYPLAVLIIVMLIEGDSWGRLGMASRDVWNEELKLLVEHPVDLFNNHLARWPSWSKAPG
jgi:hypothetical protein